MTYSGNSTSSGVGALPSDIAMKTILYVGRHTGPAGYDVGGYRYVFGGDMSFRINTMPTSHADALIQQQPTKFMEIPTELGHNSVAVEKLIGPVAAASEIKFGDEQRSALGAKGVITTGQFLIAENADICQVCAVEESAVVTNKNRILKAVGLPKISIKSTKIVEETEPDEQQVQD